MSLFVHRMHIISNMVSAAVATSFKASWQTGMAAFYWCPSCESPHESHDKRFYYAEEDWCVYECMCGATTTTEDFR